VEDIVSSPLSELALSGIQEAGRGVAELGQAHALPESKAGDEEKKPSCESAELINFTPL
jgi:hypothetical protein